MSSELYEYRTVIQNQTYETGARHESYPTSPLSPPYSEYHNHV